MDELGAERSSGTECDRVVAVFGDPQLRDASGSLPVSGHAGRLLAGLVARRRGASAEQLIDVVWPTDPPKSARAALHVHLGRLRRILDEIADGPVVERSGHTYRLRLDGWTVDVDRFHELRRRAAATAVDTAAAVDLLGEALQMANGAAFVVDGESVAPAATHQITLARLDVEEEFVDALLAADRSADAERVALELVEWEPFRERRWSLLMRAQSVRGRNADALATYQLARRTLIDELGLEPGEELRRTQMLVLSGEAQQLRWAEAPPIEAFDHPPRALGSLIGREAAVDRVESALAQSTPTVVLGAPGAGKTRLAIEVARRAGSRGVEVAWLDVRHIAFGNTEFSSAIARWVRRHPGGLIVVDNAESNIGAAAEITQAVGRVSPDAGVVITSRVPLTIDTMVERLVPLAVPDGTSESDIEQSAAVRMLREMLALRAPDARVDSALAAELVSRVSGLPLGIRLVADLAGTVSPDRVLARTVASLQFEIEPAVGAVLGGLDEQARLVFESASVVPGQLDTELIAALAGHGDVTASVSQLCECGLLQFDAGRPDAPYSMLEPLRDVAAELLGLSGRRAVVLDGLVGECVRRAAAVALPGGTTDALPLGVRLTRELPWHRQAIAHAVRHDDGERALQIAAGLELSLYALGWWATNTQLQDAALATRGEPTSARARVHAARGRPGLLHEFDEFHLGRAVEIAAQVGDRPVEAKALYHLGVKRWWDGRYDDALDVLARAAQVAVACGDWFVEQESIRFGGITMVSAGRPDEGFAIQLDVLRTVQASRNSEFLLPHVQMYLGHCRRHVGDDDAAFVDLEQARQSYERATNMASLVHLYAALAEMSIDQDSGTTALHHAARALELSARGGVSTYDPWLLCTVARVHARAGDDLAARHSAAAAITALERGWTGETHRVAVELAVVASQLGDDWSAARLIGLADAVEDRRELPFVSPAEVQRASSVRATVGAVDGLAGAVAMGARSTIGEAASRLIAPVLVG